MPDFRIVLSNEARTNVGAIYDWIAERSVPGAGRWYRAFLAALDSLANNADRCPVAPESRHFSEVVRNVTFRMRSGRTYRILFTILGTEVHVLFVRGPGQDSVEP
jgi:plasmid stabilization system protein ParE